MRTSTEKNLKPLTEFYARSFGTLVKKLTNRAGTEWDAEDCVQDAFERAIKYYDSFDPERSPIEAWFGRILQNAIRNHLNKSKGIADIEFDEEAAEGLPCEQYTERLAKDIRANIRNRKPKITEVLLLYFDKGYSARDISHIVEINYAAINQIIYRFREDIKAEFKIGGTLLA